MHALLCKDGQELFAVSKASDGEFVKAIHRTAADPIAGHGIVFDTEDEVRNAYEVLTEGGVVIRALGSLPWDKLSADIVGRFGVCRYPVRF